MQIALDDQSMNVRTVTAMRLTDYPTLGDYAVHVYGPRLNEQSTTSYTLYLGEAEAQALRRVLGDLLVLRQEHARVHIRDGQVVEP